MTTSRSVSSVTEAAEWLSRQGIAVPSPAGPAAAEERVPGPGAADRDRSDPVVEIRGPGVPPVGRARTADAPDGEPEADPYAVARSIALDRIAARDRTRHELAQALKTKNVPAEVAEQVLDRLEEVGLVNDAAFAEAWVESRQQRRHLSRPALRRELQTKGVDRDQIDAALESVDFGDELTAARELVRRRQSAVAGLPYPVRYRRLAGALSRRGFGSAIISQVLREAVGEE